MSEQSQNNQDATDVNDRFIDALIQHALRPKPETCKQKVKAAMRQITLSAGDSVETQVISKTSLVGGRLIRFTLVASLLIAVFLVWNVIGETNSAQATVARCLEIAKKVGARHYQVTLDYEHPLFGNRNIRVDLYVDGENRYAVRKSAVRQGKELWFGRNGDDFWILPPDGIQSFSDRRMLQSWLSKREGLDSELLLVTSVLERLESDFELSAQPDEMLANPLFDGQETSCRHVQGLLRDTSLNLPEQIDMWADRESGVARRIVLKWGKPDQNRRLTKTTIELMATPDLPDNWFEADSHN